MEGRWYYLVHQLSSEPPQPSAKYWRRWLSDHGFRVHRLQSVLDIPLYRDAPTEFTAKLDQVAAGLWQADSPEWTVYLTVIPSAEAGTAQETGNLAKWDGQVRVEHAVCDLLFYRKKSELRPPAVLLTEQMPVFPRKDAAIPMVLAFGAASIQEGAAQLYRALSPLPAVKQWYVDMLAARGWNVMSFSGEDIRRSISEYDLSNTLPAASLLPDWAGELEGRVEILLGGKYGTVWLVSLFSRLEGTTDVLCLRYPAP